MITFFPTWSLLLPVVAFVGWWCGRHKDTIDESQFIKTLSREYYVGLNYLLNEQPDKAVDVFIKLLEVDSDTVETHLALGNLFRRRGEVDRAIRLHQNLIARPQLSEEQRIDALVELGRDYMSAGVFDRAERIFREVIDLKNGYHLLGLQYLLEIYQQEKAWEKAIAIASQLSDRQMEISPIIAHYYCELAEVAYKQTQQQKNFKEVKSYLKQAFAYDAKSVRASLLQAKIAEQEENYKAAIKAYQSIAEYDSDFISEAIPHIAVCYLELGKQQELLDYLTLLLKEHPRVSIVLLIAEYYLQTQGIDQAVEFVTKHLQYYPSLKGIHQLVQWHLKAADGKLKEKLTVLQGFLTALLEKKPIYRCRVCGFSGKNCHWQCPGCHHWNTVKPIHGLEGD